MSTPPESTPATPGRVETVSYAGIGDEAGRSLRTQIDAITRLGWSAIELRTVDGTAVADVDVRQFGTLASALRSSGLRVVGVASRIGSWARPITGDFELDLRELEVLAHRCPALGTRYVRIMSYPNDGLGDRDWERRAIERIRALAGYAERAGLVLVHENCSGWAGAAADRMLRLVDAVRSPALRLLLDTGNGVAHGYEAYDLLTEILPHVVHVHVKDAVIDAGPAGDGVRYVLPGAGSARVRDCLRLLLRSGYRGAWSIEPHLSLRPHESHPPPSPDAALESFTAAGAALRELVCDQVLPAVPGWQPVGTGVIRGPA